MDVLTTTPSLSNSTATWTGWAMSAVTSKFYRNQSDKSKSETTSVDKEGGSIASAKTTDTRSTISSSVSQHSEDTDDHDIEEEGGDWGEMEVSS